MPDLTEYSWIAWVAVILVCVIIELLTLEFTFLMIAAGGVGGLGADLLGAEWWVQILVALILAVLLILTIRPLLLRVLHRGADPTPSNVDALIGMAGRVAFPLDDIGGQVRLANGETWTARLDEPPAEALPLGTVVTVRRVLGSVVLVDPTPPPITHPTPVISDTDVADAASSARPEGETTSTPQPPTDPAGRPTEKGV